jgi:hypothetical protein
MGEVRMPSTPEILAGLSRIAERGFAIAVAWHVVIAVAVVAAFAGWRPTRRSVQGLLSVPLVSVSVLAFSFGNPFNGFVFALLAVVLVVLGLRAPPGRTIVEPSSAGWVVAGALLVAFAWVYPHFLDGRGASAYLYAAPVGLIPCPTLLLATGFTLMAGRGGSRAFSLLLAAAGLFYGLVGVVRLGVAVDLVLVLGASALAALALSSPRAAPRRRPILPTGA